MTSLLAGRHAVITGGAQGIGLAVGRAFLAHGASVVLADVQEAALTQAVRSLGGSGVSAAVCDVSDEAAVDRLAESASEADIVVANAGILVLAEACVTPVAQWRRVLDVNLTGAFLTCTAFARRMRAAGRPGRIILTASLFGVRGGRENSAYSASKFGMIGFAQCLAAELAPHGINVNCVCPGQVDTEMLRDLFRARAGGDPERARVLESEFVRRIPAGSLGQMDDLAGTYVWLASPLSNYVTGQAVVVDGGWQVG